MSLNAVEYVKKYGWEEAKKASEGIFEGDVTYKREEINIDDVRSLVKSWGIVKSFGGLEDSKAVSKMGKHYKYLKKAIADVESVGEAL